MNRLNFDAHFQVLGRLLSLSSALKPRLIHTRNKSRERDVNPRFQLEEGFFGPFIQRVGMPLLALNFPVCVILLYPYRFRRISTDCWYRQISLVLVVRLLILIPNCYNLSLSQFPCVIVKERDLYMDESRWVETRGWLARLPRKANKDYS